MGTVSVIEKLFNRFALQVKKLTLHSRILILCNVTLKKQ